MNLEHIKKSIPGFPAEIIQHGVQIRIHSIPDFCSSIVISAGKPGVDLRVWFISAHASCFVKLVVPHSSSLMSKN